MEIKNKKPVILKPKMNHAQITKLTLWLVNKGAAYAAKLSAPRIAADAEASLGFRVTAGSCKQVAEALGFEFREKVYPSRRNGDEFADHLVGAITALTERTMALETRVQLLEGAITAEGGL
tara:strand:- start:2060 stop:2422 length:363 start_codon:yes stop_codon:yes gene_type:complete